MGKDCCGSTTGKSSSKKKNDDDFGKRYNWKAIAIMLMFGFTMMMTAFILISDYLDPSGRDKGDLRRKLVNCYESANPSSLGKVDGLVEKYWNSQRGQLKLFAKLEEAYPKVDDCIFLTRK